MDFVPIVLAGQTYRLRFIPDDIEDICNRLTPIQAPNSPVVSPAVLGQMLVNNFPLAINYALLYGLRHTAELKRIDLPDVRKLVREAFAAGQQYNDFRRPIIKALVGCGLADFAAVVKALEEAEAQAAATEEDDAGNGSMPSRHSLIKSSMTASPPAASESSI
jgi:hypothetical protein